MEDDQIPLKPVSLWIPMTNPGDVALIGKLGEELGECISAKDRCLIQGLDGAEPETGKVNKVWLEDEIADVLALTFLAKKRFKLDTFRIRDRMLAKVKYKEAWLAELDALWPPQ